MKSIPKNKNGITLIALIITIIVLLILAGVSIALVVGDNGIATKAVKSKTQSAIGDVRDASEIIRAEYEVENEGKNPTARYIIEELIDQGKIVNSQVKDYGDENGIGIVTVENEDVIINGRVELDEFTIGDVTYKTVDGWTFAQWIESEYNTDGIYIFEWRHPSGTVGGDILSRYGDMLWGRFPEGDRGVFSSEIIDTSVSYMMTLY